MGQVSSQGESKSLRPAVPGDAPDIARLVLLSAATFLPAVFGPRIEGALGTLAAGRGTLFSFSHCVIAVSPGRAGGMLLGYSAAEKKAEDPATGWGLLHTLGPALLLRLGRLLALQRAIGRTAGEEFYVSNVAVYPELRGRGIGSLLLADAERRAVPAGAASVVLDVETDNPSALRLYERLGYAPKGRTAPLRMEGHAFSFLRMGKPVSR
jgi:ribosomal protein S18 acetylase RimI-like enzyme